MHVSPSRSRPYYAKLCALPGGSGKAAIRRPLQDIHKRLASLPASPEVAELQRLVAQHSSPLYWAHRGWMHRTLESVEQEQLDLGKLQVAAALCALRGIPGWGAGTPKSHRPLPVCPQELCRVSEALPSGSSMFREAVAGASWLLQLLT